MKKMIDNIRKYLPAVLLLVLLLFCIRYREDLSVERILSYTPEEPVKAALLMLGLYAVKSVSFIFPIAILQLAVGHLFSTGTALLVNFLGRAVTLALPYWMGRFSGSSMVENLTSKYPKLKTVVDYQNGNPLYISIFMRTLNFLPGRCSEPVSGRGERSRLKYIWLGGDAGNISGSYPSHDIWSKYQESRITGILAFRSASCDDQCILGPDT
ncbi:MAG: hypothetical protein ACLTQN_07210 [Blautia massiliensis (ex Durand et al. 2017)]